MKTNLLKKGKWYIVGFILVVIMLSVGLSFCTWDDYSFKAVSANGKTGSYYDTAELNQYVTLVVDNNGNKVADVGDKVQYGRFWQDENADGEAGLKPQRWIVVDIDANNVATLLAEKVVVFGNFWGSTAHFHDYYRSTLRAWLNSGRDSVTGSGTDWIIGNIGAENKRDDGIGSAFSGNESQVNKGFLDVAFDKAEQSILVAKNISGMEGRAKDSNAEGYKFVTRGTNKNSINDLVWVPSWSEIYGTTTAPGGTVIDGSPSKQFEYYKGKVTYNTNNPVLVSGATAYAWNASANSYYNNGGGSTNGSTGATWWWLRSPYPSNYYHSLMVNTVGSGSIANTNHSYGGVRPAVCVQL